MLAALDQEVAEAEADPSIKGPAATPPLRARPAHRGGARASEDSGLEMPTLDKTAREQEHMRGHAQGGGTEAGAAGASAAASFSALASLKFTYVVSCQVFGEQQRKSTPEAAAIRRLMRDNPSLRIAYVDTVAAPTDAGIAGFPTPGSRAPAAAADSAHDQRVFSVLVKWDAQADCVREVYRVELPGPILIGEGKPENQNHAIIFTRGEALQAIDMNQVGISLAPRSCWPSCQPWLRLTSAPPLGIACVPPLR